MDTHHHHNHNEDMLQVEEALELILANFRKLPSEVKPILDTLGQTLDESITATFDIPPLENSAMDGYALRYEDISHTTPDHPTTLEVIGEVAAGHISNKEVRPGSAIRIMTGAPIPDGADTVIPFEDTDEIDRKNSGKKINQINHIANGKSTKLHWIALYASSLPSKISMKKLQPNN